MSAMTAEHRGAKQYLEQVFDDHIGCLRRIHQITEIFEGPDSGSPLKSHPMGSQPETCKYCDMYTRARRAKEAL